MTHVHIDFETRSAVDLKKAGAHAYAEDATTDIWCIAIAKDFAPIHLLTDADCRKPAVATGLAKMIDEGATFVAHNASFELAIWNGVMAPRYGWPQLPVEQVRCTMCMAYALGLPGSLEMAAAAVGIDATKDMEGHALMMRMAKPRRKNPDGTFVWWDDDERRQRLYVYCKQDVEVERRLAGRLLALSETEQEMWAIDRRINDRGIRIDRKAITRAIEVVEEAKRRLDLEMAHTTAGYVPGCSNVIELTEWLKSRGIETEGVAKADVAELLARDDLPHDVRRALELRRDAAKSSTAKLKAMLSGASDDDRVRDTMQYHGAATGRWAGRRIQPHNFPRGSIKGVDPDQVLNLLTA